MSKDRPRCRECFCEDYTQSERHRGRYLVTRETSFSCGALQTEFLDSESNIGRIEFEGRGCSPDSNRGGAAREMG